MVVGDDSTLAHGYRVNKKRVTPTDINEILQRVRYQPENAVINQIIIRAMSKAVYSSANIGHFGLGFTDYSHFTSPIRRYPDLIVHRLLKEYSEGIPDNKRLKKLRDLTAQIHLKLLNSAQSNIPADFRCFGVCNIHSQKLLCRFRFLRFSPFSPLLRLPVKPKFRDKSDTVFQC